MPSIIQYDEHQKPFRYGYEADPTGPGTIKWFKLLLASDDDSAVRRKAEQFVARGSLDEESVVRDYLAHLLSSALKQAAVMHGKRSWRILAALLSQTDQLSRQRYRECLSAAYERVQMHVDLVRFFRKTSPRLAAACLAADHPDRICMLSMTAEVAQPIFTRCLFRCSWTRRWFERTSGFQNISVKAAKISRCCIHSTSKTNIQQSAARRWLDSCVYGTPTLK